MRLTRFRVRKFRNIIDSGDINTEPDVTCLVGMNEAGKTAVLSALHRLNPVGKAAFLAQRDYPRWLLTKERKAGVVEQTRPIEATFVLDADEVAALGERLGDGVLTEDTFTVYRKYDDEMLYLSVPLDEAKAVKALLAGVDVAKPHMTPLAKMTTFTELRAHVASATNDSGAAEALEPVTAAINDLLGDKDLTRAAINFLFPLLPKFFYFGEYSILEGRIDLKALAASDEEETASTSDQTARSLLALADTTPASLTEDDYEDRRAELEAVSNDLTRQVFDYWKQNPNLRVRFDIDPKIETDVHGRDRITKNYLDIRVEDTRHYFTNNFSQRSSGFRWFFSFLAAFTEFESRNDNFVILLDEPALTLHGRAQADFLRFINERLATVGTVIYTTHSPFMVETDKLERTRIVEDQGPDKGAVVSQEAMTVASDSLFPLQAALGYDIAQHLFIGNTNLLVEGPSDLLYLDLVGRRLSIEGRASLDERWRILPAGGSSNIPAFVSLIGRELDVTVLVDSGTEGAGRLDAALSAGRLKKSRLVRVGEVTGTNHSDIEDLFSVSDYLALYNQAFSASVKEKDLPKGDRIVQRLTTLKGKFDHYKPADVLLRDPLKIDGLSASTLDSFEKLIERINSTLD